MVSRSRGFTYLTTYCFHNHLLDTIEFKSEYNEDELDEIQQIVQINYDNIGNYTNSTDRKVKQGKLLLVSLLEV